MSVDELVDALGGGFAVGDNQHVDPAAPHPRFSAYYKNRGAPESTQERRRAEHLNEQKKQRFDSVMHARAIALNELEEEEEPMDLSARTRPRYYPNQQHARKYRDQLMLSEWLVDIPEDLESEWLMVPVPEGKRTLVVAAQEVTTAYSKSGWLINQFPSLLPGGHRAGHPKSSFSLLDCVFSQVDGAFYVLDMMCWNSNPFYDSEYRFVPLPNCPCEKGAMETMMRNSFDFKSKMDGLLFYHKRVHYLMERTPLVGWLKPFMLPEMLSVSVPEHFMEGHQDETAAHFREDFDKEQQQKVESIKAARESAKEVKQENPNEEENGEVMVEVTDNKDKETMEVQDAQQAKDSGSVIVTEV